MARTRPTASDVSQSPALDAAQHVSVGRDNADALTRAQASALRRCSPLSSSEFKEQRQVIAQQHRFSVMRILRDGATDDSVVVPQRPQRTPRATVPTAERRWSRLRRND